MISKAYQQAINSIPLMSSCNPDVARAALSTWVTKREQHVAESLDTLLSISETLDNGATVSSTDIDQLLSMRCVDESGLVHGFTRMADGSISLDYGDKKLIDAEGHILSDDLALYLDVFSEQGEANGEFLSMVNLCLSQSETGEVSTAFLNTLYMSQNDSVKSFAQEMLSTGATVNLRSVADYLHAGLTDISQATSETSQDDIGYQFDVSDYSRPQMRNILAGLWSVINSVTPLVASVAMICGRGLLAGIGAAIWIGSQVYSTIKGAYQSATSMSYGSGTSDVYANAFVFSLGGSFPRRMQQRWLLPWAIVNFQSINDTGECKVLIYPRTSHPGVFPLSVDSPQSVKLVPSSDTEYMQWISAISSKMSAGVYCPNHTSVDDVFSAVMANIGATIWWLALRLYETSSSRPYSSWETTTLVAPSEFGLPDTWILAGGVGSFVDPASYNWYSSMSVTQKWNCISDFISHSSWSTADSYFMYNLRVAYSRLLQNQHSLSPYYTVTADFITSRMRALMYNQIPDTYMNEPSMTSDISVYPRELDVIDPYLTVDESPQVETDPWITQPQIDGRSLMRAILLTITLTAAVATTAILARRAIKNAQRRKVLRREAKAIEAQEAFKADPSDANAKACLKAQRKFARSANRAGYSSNNVGTFSSGLGDLGKLESQLEYIPTSSSGLSSDTSILLQRISGYTID